MSGTVLSFFQQAFWRGIPFYVDAASVEKGRKTAVHDYPFRDGGWVEDLGRRQRVYRFQGHLIGDYVSVLQIALDAACELPGPGLLVHPTLGAVMVSLLSCTSVVSKDKLRVISVEFQFMEQGSSLFPSIVTSTITNVISTVSNALSAFGAEIAVASVLLSFAAGAVSAVEGSNVVLSYAKTATAGASDPGSLVALATALPPADPTTWYGRYSSGSAIDQLPDGTTVATLQASVAAQQVVVAGAVTAAVAAVATFSQVTAPATIAAISGITEAVRVTQSNPADQVNTLIAVAGFSYTDQYGGTGLSGDMATVRDAFAAACRRCALASLALAAASYQPISYDDAVAIRTAVVAAIDIEITAAGDAGDDDTYLALRSLRAAVILDLTTRGASLPLVETFTLPAPLPSLVVAYRLYKDASRSDQIAGETNARHPGFQPVVIQALAA